MSKAWQVPGLGPTSNFRAMHAGIASIGPSGLNDGPQCPARFRPSQMRDCLNTCPT